MNVIINNIIKKEFLISKTKLDINISIILGMVTTL